MKTYTIDLNELQKNGQCATEAVVCEAYARGIINKKQYEQMSRMIVIAQTNDGFIDRFLELLRFKKPQECASQVIWIVYEAPSE